MHVAEGVAKGSMDRLSEREIGAVRKLADKEQKERKYNIAVKGINWQANKDIEKGKEGAQKYIKEKIGM